MNPHGRSGLIAAAAILVVDQASKWWVLEILRLPEIGQVPVLPVFSLTMVWNTGVTFGLFGGLGDWGPWLLTGVAAVVVAALGVWLHRAENALIGIALGTIAGGAVGNIIDRVRFGAVVDFLHLHAYGWSWYVFNIADAAIVCGVGALVLDGLLPRSRLPAPPVKQ